MFLHPPTLTPAPRLPALPLFLPAALPRRQQFKTGKSAQTVAELLVDIALKRYTTDNVAVVVADLRGKDAWAAKPAKPARKGLLSSLFGNGKKA